MRKLSVILIVLWFSSVAFGQVVEKRVPTIDELLTIRTLSGSLISPGGEWVCYSLRETDFEGDRTVSQLWLVEVASGASFQLTRGESSAGGAQWSPDGKWLSFTSSRGGGRSQIYVIDPRGGEAVCLTDSETGVGSYEWSADGARIAYAATEPEGEEVKGRKEYMGDWEVVQSEYRHRHLWVFEVGEALKGPMRGEQITEGQDFTVGSFSWSPDGSRIAFSGTVNPDLTMGSTSDIYTLHVKAKMVEKIVDWAGSDSGPQWSPDGEEILFSSYMGDADYNAKNSRLAVVSALGGAVRSLTDGFDEKPRFVAWNGEGIYFSGSQKTATHLFRLDPASREITRITSPRSLMASSFSMTEDGKLMAFTANSPTTMNEVFVAEVDDFAPRQLTDMTREVEEFELGRRELVSWKSQDGTEIEGVLTKPAHFDANVKHPLLCVIHGGPTGIDRPGLLNNGRRNYPVDIWAARGALILQVNYRGSAGYGEAFRRLNMRNLGVGDAWDVLTGIDYLVEKGWVDEGKIGCMGWSQGGYISAFLTCSTDRFAAVSVGAGISNWATYYYNTDITQFTINYLGDDPVDDPEVYRKTSPMSYIKDAGTPTLIQHGEFDRRVPIPNAYELRQGLVDRGVPVEMVVYKGFGHGISTPKAQRAVMWHNLVWFNHYLWGDPLGDLTRPEIPEEEVEGKEIRFLALGDSYTIGESVAAAERWPMQLAMLLRAEGVTVAKPQIIARTGWTTGELQAGIEKARPVGPFDLVSLSIGVNNQYRGLDVEEYRVEYRELLKQAIGWAGGEPGRVVVLSIPDWSVTPFAAGRDRAKIAREIIQFNLVKRQESWQAGVQYVDVTGISQRAAKDAELVAGDGLHPSGKMYGEWARQALPVVMKAVKDK